MLKLDNCTIDYEDRKVFIKTPKDNITLMLYYSEDVEIFDIFTIIFNQMIECEWCDINGTEYEQVVVSFEKKDVRNMNITFTKDGKIIHSIK